MLHLDYRDSRPIHQQVRDGLRRLMVTGVLQPGDQLPSVRKLATELAINPNTIQRAYNELEGEGYIYSVPGKGSFAASVAGADTERKRELLARVREMLSELRYLGVSRKELLALYGLTPEALCDAARRAVAAKKTGKTERNGV